MAYDLLDEAMTHDLPDGARLTIYPMQSEELFSMSLPAAKPPLGVLLNPVFSEIFGTWRTSLRPSSAGPISASKQCKL